MGQRFVVDATLLCDLRAAGRSDDVADTVDYAAVYRCAGRCASALLHLEEAEACKVCEGLYLTRALWAHTLRRHIKEIVEGPPYMLLEAVAERVADGILQGNAGVTGVHISVCKPHVAVGGVVESLGAVVLQTWPASLSCAAELVISSADFAVARCGGEEAQGAFCTAYIAPTSSGGLPA